MSNHIHAAIAAFQDAMPTVPKNRTARTPSGYTYRYADLADVTNAARPILAEHGLVFFAQPGLSAGGEAIITGRLVHVESGEEVIGSLPLKGRHPQDVGSAITYARRYLLGCLTGLITEDDDDAAGTTTDAANGVGNDDREAALDAALAEATSVGALDGIYTQFGIGNAPERIKAKFFARSAAITGESE